MARRTRASWEARLLAAPGTLVVGVVSEEVFDGDPDEVLEPEVEAGFVDEELVGEEVDEESVGEEVDPLVGLLVFDVDESDEESVEEAAADELGSAVAPMGWNRAPKLWNLPSDT